MPLLIPTLLPVPTLLPTLLLPIPTLLLTLLLPTPTLAHLDQCLITLVQFNASRQHRVDDVMGNHFHPPFDEDDDEDDE